MVYAGNYDKNNKDVIIVLIDSSGYNSNQIRDIFDLTSDRYVNFGYLWYHTSCYLSEEAILDFLLNPHINYGRPFKVFSVFSDVLTVEAKSLLLPYGIIWKPVPNK